MHTSESDILSASTVIACNIARQVLGEDPSLNELSAHQLACRGIRERNFCPPIELHQAIITLSSPLSLIDDPVFAEQIAATRLQEFCVQFFSIPQPQRRDLWNVLDKQLARMPQLHWRLRALKDGLEIECPAVKLQASVDTLAHDICELFVMPPRASFHALRQLCVSAAEKDRGRELGERIDELYRTRPTIAALRPIAALPEILIRIRGQQVRQASDAVGHYLELNRVFRISVSLIGLGFAAFFLISSLMGPEKFRQDKTPLSIYEQTTDKAFRDGASKKFMENILKQNLRRGEASSRATDSGDHSISVDGSAAGIDTIRPDGYEDFVIRPDGTLVSNEDGRSSREAITKDSSAKPERPLQSNDPLFESRFGQDVKDVPSVPQYGSGPPKNSTLPFLNRSTERTGMMQHLGELDVMSELSDE